MKVIPSAMVSSKLFSVSASTVPFRGGKATVKHITHSTWDNALGLQEDKAMILNAANAYSKVTQNCLHDLHFTNGTLGQSSGL